MVVFHTLSTDSACAVHTLRCSPDKKPAACQLCNGVGTVPLVLVCFWALYVQLLYLTGTQHIHLQESRQGR